jgi:hypothetical protein
MSRKARNCCPQLAGWNHSRPRASFARPAAGFLKCRRAHMHLLRAFCSGAKRIENPSNISEGYRGKCGYHVRISTASPLSLRQTEVSPRCANSARNRANFAVRKSAEQDAIVVEEIGLNLPVFALARFSRVSPVGKHSQGGPDSLRPDFGPIALKTASASTVVAHLSRRRPLVPLRY